VGHQPHRGRPADPEVVADFRCRSGKAAARPQGRAVLQDGVRSAEALAALKQAGFSDAVHLKGGIVAWAQQMQPDMVMY